MLFLYVGLSVLQHTIEESKEINIIFTSIAHVTVHKARINPIAE
jgi:hypothetical protein